MQYFINKALYDFFFVRSQLSIDSVFNNEGVFSLYLFYNIGKIC